MKAFSSFSKSTFWSQLLFGLVAIFSLPAVSNLDKPLENSPQAQQVLTLNFSTLKKTESTQSLFLQHIELTPRYFLPQATEFYEFCAKPYRLLSFHIPPIRAGPTV